jgi:carbon storage regulator CsrA
MLVLSRKSNQALVIDHDVVVTVVEIGDDFVRLAVAAPNEDEIGRRYPKARDVPQADDDRPIVITLSLHHGAVLDRLRRQMTDDESPPPSRDEALAALLEAVADADDFSIPRVTSPRALPR